ncbi:MAG: exo-alpha-sialidase [Calditrichaeota bacterium]|nr:exo-alpha-sialidase [Calditrichota bacterium]
MRMRWILFVGMCLALAALAYAQKPPTHFRMSARGLALEARSGVPVSGVVLYQPDASQPAVSPFDEIGPNRRCNQDPIGSAQNETPGAASPVNTNNVLAGANDYRNGDASGGFYCTTDGGNSWYDALVTRGPVGVFEGAGDPVPAVDNTGRMYAAYIAFDRTTPDNGLYVQTSTNNGASWSSPVAVAQHIGGADSDFEDKPYAACDYSPDSPYQNNYYITWTKFELGGGSPIYFSRSTNGGASFSAPLRISTSSSCQFSCPAVGPNGEVYAVWYSYSNSTIKFDRSTNGGTTWGSDITVASFDDYFPSNPCGSFRTPSYPVIACDISNGPRRGWLYVCWADARNGNPDIYFSRSTNGGTSWSAASRMDDDVTGRWQWWQWMAVHPTNGDIGVSWLDRREDPAGCQYKTYATISTDGGTTWLPNFAVADVASNPTGADFLGDYCGTTFRSDGFYSVWVDLRNEVAPPRPGDCYAAWWNTSFGPSPTGLVITPSGADAQLRWNPTGAPYYRVYSDAQPFGVFSTFEGSSSDTSFFDLNALSGDTMKFYQVRASTGP